ncbi:actin-binding Rho-activating protein isoform X2 [Lepeophtheirus salmonis]|uniref:actin-binding Rho-activating protein isoform X2 n=1 Tax=Lepeophtheirus salmonis TaxID=72036 RepID=UPI001AE8BAB5|nr:actin-binding Rho-activating protein-like isoform X2 [Lepeophtheirus salmonis]
MSFSSIGICKGSRAENTAMLLTKQQNDSSKSDSEWTESKHCGTNLQTRKNHLLENMSKSRFVKDFKPLKKTDPGYGCPQEGTRTEARGIKAQFHVHKEILELCEILYMYGLDDGASSMSVMLFGDLFRIYTKISDKVVGILLRAKKYGLVDFEPEILFQGQNDNTPIYLKRSMEDIYEEFNKNKKFSD